MIGWISRILSDFEVYSFWLGFLVASLFWWIVGKFSGLARRAAANMRAQAQSARAKAKAGVEYHYGNELYQRLQSMHLAAPLFSLDEILVPPRLMALPPALPTQDTEERVLVDITFEAIPYLPDWPELSAAFNAPTVSLAEALSKGANLVLLGHAGSGKSVALAHLAGQIVKGEQEVGELHRFLPILIHAADLITADLGGEQPVQVLGKALVAQFSSRVASRLNKLLEEAFASQRVLLLVDGMDELDRSNFDAVSGFLGKLLALHGSSRVVAAASPFYYDGLARLGLIPVAMAAWSEAQRAAFLQNWGEKWVQFIRQEVWEFSGNGAEGSAQHMEPAILNNWIGIDTLAQTPLELTLRAWAAYAGDARGPTNADAFEAYARRMSAGVNGARLALERIALQMALKTTPFPTLRSTNRWARGLNLDEAEDSTTPESENSETEETAEPSSGTVNRQTLPGLIQSGLLVERADGRVGFVHPALGGYFSGKALATSGGSSWVQNQPNWTGKHQSLQYLAHFGTPLGATSSLSNASEDPLRQQLLFAGRWLPESFAHPKAPWRVSVMREYFSQLGAKDVPLGLRARALAALLYSKDPNVTAVCQRLLAHNLPAARQIGALGAGYLKDKQMVGELGELLYDSDPGVQGACCLALVAIGTPAALEAVAAALLHGDENLQRLAAEALANHPEEGHPVLREASTFDDLLPRRAAVYGLARIREAWARETLENMRTLDKEWIVRNAAEQVITHLEKSTPHLPERTLPLHETPWLLLFAARTGEGIAPGLGAEDVLRRALLEGTEAERIAACRLFPHVSEETAEAAISDLFEMYLQETGPVQEAAYLALWHLAAAGHDIPSSVRTNSW